MNTTPLSSAAIDLIQSYGNTANNVINACRAGGERLSSLVGQRYTNALNATGDKLSQETREHALVTEKILNTYYIKGIELSSSSASAVVNNLVKFTGLGLQQVATNLGRLQDKTGVTALNSLAQAAMPAVQAVNRLALQLEEKTASLVTLIAGSPASKPASAFSKARARRKA